MVELHWVEQVITSLVSLSIVRLRCYAEDQISPNLNLEQNIICLQRTNFRHHQIEHPVLKFKILKECSLKVKGVFGKKELHPIELGEFRPYSGAWLHDCWGWSRRAWSREFTPYANSPPHETNLRVGCVDPTEVELHNSVQTPVNSGYGNSATPTPTSIKTNTP